MDNNNNKMDWQHLFDNVKVEVVTRSGRQLDSLSARSLDKLRDKSKEADEYWLKHQKVLEQELAHEGFTPSTGIGYKKYHPRKRARDISTVPTKSHSKGWNVERVADNLTVYPDQRRNWEYISRVNIYLPPIGQVE